MTCVYCRHLSDNISNPELPCYSSFLTSKYSTQISSFKNVSLAQYCLSSLSFSIFRFIRSLCNVCWLSLFRRVLQQTFITFISSCFSFCTIEMSSILLNTESNAAILYSLRYTDALSIVESMDIGFRLINPPFR